jgi:hypothetical protein
MFFCVYIHKMHFSDIMRLFVLWFFNLGRSTTSVLDTETGEFLSEWLHYSWSTPREAVAFALYESGFATSDQQVYERVTKISPSANRSELLKLKKSFFDFMVHIPWFHEEIARRLSCEDFNDNDIWKAATDMAILAPIVRYRDERFLAKAAGIWMRLCVCPLRRGEKSCETKVVQDEAGKPVSVWYLRRSAQQEYLLSEIFGSIP